MSFEAFLKIDGIDGESKDSKHKGEIEVLSFNWGAAQPGLATGQPVRRAGANVSEVTVVKKIDTASPQLLLQSCGGSAAQTAVLTARKPSDSEGAPVEFLKITMTNVVVSSISAQGDSQTGSDPLEQVSLNFGHVEFAVTSDSGQTVMGSCGAAPSKG